MILTREDKTWAEGVRDRIVAKMKPVVERNKDKIPYTAVNGHFDDKSGPEEISWWTNGFWGGINWQLYALTKDPLYRQEAIGVENKLDTCLMHWTMLDHDNGFKWLPTAVAHYRLEKDEESRNRGILAANNMLGRFNLAGRFFRAWNDWGDIDRRGMAIIDCMMNLPLLYWASDTLGDPRFREAAIAHADTAEKYFIRPDGSVNHILRFDPETGELLESIGGQGYGVGSSWTRGQSWAIYGFTISYIHTGDRKYLDAARRVANYVIANIPENGLIPIDYRQPAEPALEDSTAAAITASGLIELAKNTEGRDSDLYLRIAIRLLRVLDEKRCSWSPEVDELLEKCSASYHEETHEYPIIYGDYYFIEAVLKLLDAGIFIW